MLQGSWFHWRNLESGSVANASPLSRRGECRNRHSAVTERRVSGPLNETSLQSGLRLPSGRPAGIWGILSAHASAVQAGGEHRSRVLPRLRPRPSAATWGLITCRMQIRDARPAARLVQRCGDAPRTAPPAHGLIGMPMRCVQPCMSCPRVPAVRPGRPSMPKSATGDCLVAAPARACARRRHKRHRPVRSATAAAHTHAPTPPGSRWPAGAP